MATLEEKNLIREVLTKTSAHGEILARLDERSNNTWAIVDKMEKHQVEQNSSIQRALKLANKNAIWVTVFKWVTGLGFAGIISWLLQLQFGGI